MSLVNDGAGNMVMPVGPMGGYGNGSLGWGGDGSFWIIILFLFAMMNGNWGGFGNNGGGAMPYIMNNTTNSDMQRGFDQQAIMGGINGINTALANAEVSRCNSQANILQTLNQNQTAANQAMNSLAMSLQNCCCENRAGVADLKYTVATEACADRQAVTNALFDVTTANNNNTQQLANAINNGIQSIQDKLCSLELEGVKNQLAQANRENAALQSQLAVSNQNALIQHGFATEVDNLYNRLNNCPVPTTPVYGRTPIFTCNNGMGGCGCGCGGNGFVA